MIILRTPELVGSGSGGKPGTGGGEGKPGTGGGAGKPGTGGLRIRSPNAAIEVQTRVFSLFFIIFSVELCA